MIRSGHPMTTAAAVPRTGSMSGATSMAPITTAVESARIPSTAIAVANNIREANRVKNWRRGTPWGKRWPITSRRSMSSSGSRPSHSRLTCDHAARINPAGSVLRDRWASARRSGRVEAAFGPTPSADPGGAVGGRSSTSGIGHPQARSPAAQIFASIDARLHPWPSLSSPSFRMAETG